MIRPLSYLLAILLTPALVAQSPLQGLTAHLKEAAVVHVDFSQNRTLAALSRPLKSSGSLVLARELGVIWELRKPVALTYVMGPKGLTVINGAGRKERRSAREAPVVAQMGKVFQALIQGDWQALDPYFTVTGSGTAQRWEVVLQPKAQTASFLKRVQLAGGRFIERIRIDEPSGDHMELSFEHQRLDLPLTDAERGLLAQD